MAYSLKKRKQLSKSSKKNKTKRTRRFRKQYGGDLSKPQKKYIEKQIEDLHFTDVQKKEVIRYFDKISWHLSKKSFTNDKLTVLHDFFENVKSNYGRNITVEDKREIFSGLLFDLYYRYKDEDPVTDKEDDD